MTTTHTYRTVPLKPRAYVEVVDATSAHYRRLGRVLRPDIHDPAAWVVMLYVGQYTEETEPEARVFRAWQLAAFEV